MLLPKFHAKHLISSRFLSEANTSWIFSVFGVFLVHIFPHLDWIRRDTKDLSKCGKVRTRKTPNTDTFHAAKCAFTNSCFCKIIRNFFDHVSLSKNQSLTFLQFPDKACSWNFRWWYRLTKRVKWWRHQFHYIFWKVFWFLNCTPIDLPGDIAILLSPFIKGIQNLLKHLK